MTVFVNVFNTFEHNNMLRILYKVKEVCISSQGLLRLNTGFDTIKRF